MYKYAVILLLFAGCQRGGWENHEAELKAAMDSTALLVHELDATFERIVNERDSLARVLHERDQLIYLTFQQAHKYAVIVRGNPSQSIFIVGWIDRSFSWIPKRTGTKALKPNEVMP